MGTQNSIFISYRRDDSADVTGRIYDRLVSEFGKETVFKDVDSIPLGVDCKEYIGEIVGRCKVVLVVIGKKWIGISDESGRRLDHPEDLVAIEIAAALEHNIVVIPLLVQNAPMPREKELPKNIKKLAYRNGMDIKRDPHFHRDMDRLIKSLREIINGPGPRSTASWWRMHIDQAEGVGDYIFKELRKGRLRQGWGYRADQNLDSIKRKLAAGKELNEHQKDCWKGNRKLHQDEDQGMQKGNLVLLHNTPKYGFWVVAEITGNYRYSISDEYGDYGHIRSAKLLTNKPIEIKSLDISNDFWNAVKTPFRLIQLDVDKYEQDLAILRKICRS